jgi:amidase
MTLSPHPALCYYSHPFFIANMELKTSCLTEMFFEEAQERAKHLDELRAKGKIVGPLHGLPVSLKDSFQVRGTEATLGFIAYLDHGPSQENSDMVDTLLNLGAVLYCKTNIPQTLMVCGTFAFAQL